MLTEVPSKKVLLIGCGKMGEAMLSGWCASNIEPAALLNGENFVVVEPNSERASNLKDSYGVETVEDVSELDGHFDLVIFAVKPQQVGDVLDSISSSSLDLDDSLFITIAAGMQTSRFEDALGDGARVVRVMPNMPLQVGKGASVVAGGANATEADVELVNSLFDALGTSSVVDEDQIDAVCAISGGGPAYVAYMIEALRDAGVAYGLDAGLAESLALETVGGTYAAMSSNGTSPEDMRISVSSPGGTTLAALGVMDEASFKPMFQEAVGAAIDRARELREGSSS